MIAWKLIASKQRIFKIEQMKPKISQRSIPKLNSATQNHQIAQPSDAKSSTNTHFTWSLHENRASDHKFTWNCENARLRHGAAAPQFAGFVPHSGCLRHPHRQHDLLLGVVDRILAGAAELVVVGARFRHLGGFDSCDCSFDSKLMLKLNFFFFLRSFKFGFRLLSQIISISFLFSKISRN